MEYIWYIIAALGAGIGTGLAGLSAATVMVPILIVLCPSFGGEMGAYHATAIALASDILGSAFTARIYAKNKNIDLKRGAIMFICIIGMCVTGSFAAFHVGNVVLGSFSLFLCVGIGIRFLLKPETQKEHPMQKGAKLDLKGIIISLFFGLTIGFGTGFVGSGGGMMMLVVFTAFLGMQHKTAVGTSTCIMTFTALIAFVSHALIEPDIFFARWDVLLICMTVATLASIGSAQFANRVNAKTVSLVTGAVLTVLGIVMLLIHYWDWLSVNPILGQALSCMGLYLLFLGAFIIIILLMRIVFHVRGEPARKLLHIPALLSVVLMLCVAETWQAAVLCAAVFCVAVYPILCIAEHWKGYQALLMERQPGEIKKSLFLMFGTHIVLVILGCGVLGKSYLTIASILIWGIGDAAAALIGKRFGKHKITNIPYADHNKTWEGTFAMAAMSAITGVLVLLVTSPLHGWQCVLYALLAAPFSAGSELCSHHGNDTITVPFTIFIILAGLSFL